MSKIFLRLNVSLFAMSSVMYGASAWAQVDPATPTAVASLLDRRLGFAEGAGEVARVRMSVERSSVPADGQTPTAITINLQDRAGRPVGLDTIVTLETTAGRFQLPQALSDELGHDVRDLDASTPGLQVLARAGEVRVLLLAPIEPTEARISVSAGGASALGVVRYIPDLREMIAVGLVDGVLSFDVKRPLSIDPVRPEDGFEDELNDLADSSGDGKRTARARSAFFLKGKVRGDVLLTMAFDSDKPRRDRLFRDLDPERYYPVYGDASITGFEARSNSRLYLRLDKGRNYLLYGDIVTGDGFSQRFGQGEVSSAITRDLGQYNRAMTGLRAHLENDRGALDIYAAYDNLHQVVEEFPGRGLSGPYTVSNSASAILGSERVERVVRDRNAPSRIIEVQQLSRFMDYTFEPFSGRILFSQPVPSVDSALNPVSVRITYEVEQGGKKFWTYGANGQYRLTENVDVGGSYVKDDNPLTPYQLGSANATLHLGETTFIRAEVARTRSAYNTLPGLTYTATPGTTADGSRSVVGGGSNFLRTDQVSGDAWRLHFQHRDQNFNVGAWYGESDAAFNNPASSFLGGRRQAGLEVGLDLSDQFAVYTQGSYVKDRVGGASRSQVAAGLRYTPNKQLTFELGANRIDEAAGDLGFGNGLTVPSPITAPFGVGVVSPGFGGFYGGGSTNAINPGTGQSLTNTGYGWGNGNYGSWVGNGLAGVPVSYTALRAAVQWRPTEWFDISGEVEQDLDHVDHRRAALGAGIRLNQKSRMYARYEWHTGLSSVGTGGGPDSPYDTSGLVIGIDSEYMEGGTAFNEYRMYDAFSARQAQWASGLRNQWRISPQVTLNTGIERLKILDGNGQESLALSGAIEWRPSELWLLNGRLEWRRTDVSDGADNSVPRSFPGTGQDGNYSTLAGGYDSWLSTVTVARKVSRDWTLLARNYYLRNSYNADLADSYEDRFQFGFAYRDTDTNRLNVLGKYEYWTRRDNMFSLADDGTQSSRPEREGFNKHVGSIHADWHPSRPWWIMSHVAGKRQTDFFDGRTDSYTAYLASGRITYDMSERWDLSLLGAHMWSPGGASQSAVGVEVGHMVTSNLWLSAGYNVRGFRDDDLTQGEYTNKGFFLRLRFKFDENLLRGGDPTVNPALPR